MVLCLHVPLAGNKDGEKKKTFPFPLPLSHFPSLLHALVPHDKETRDLNGSERVSGRVRLCHVEMEPTAQRLCFLKATQGGDAEPVTASGRRPV